MVVVVEERQLEMNVTAISDTNENVEGVVASFRDLSREFLLIQRGLPYKCP